MRRLWDTRHEAATVGAGFVVGRPVGGGGVKLARSDMMREEMGGLCGEG